MDTQEYYSECFRKLFVPILNEFRRINNAEPKEHQLNIILAEAVKLFQAEQGLEATNKYLRKIIRDAATSFFFGYDQFLE